MHTKFIKYLIIFLTPVLYAESIVIDAKLDESDWDNALVINDYYETVPYTLVYKECPGSRETLQGGFLTVLI